MGEIDGDELEARLRRLFEAARAADEFEFASTLLRVRGLASQGWDPFEETASLVDDLVRLIDAPLAGHTRVRLGLLLYSHLTEVEAVYSLLANLAAVTRGERYSISPFADLARTNRRGDRFPPSATRIVRHVEELLVDTGYELVAELLPWFFDSGVRNAFAHADYTLHGDVFRAPGERFLINGVLTSEMPIARLGDRFNRALMFHEAVRLELTAQRASYKENRIVAGRIQGAAAVPVELLADPQQGLHGFRAPPGASPGTGASSQNSPN